MVDEGEDGVVVVIAVVEESTEKKLAFSMGIVAKTSLKFEGLTGALCCLMDCLLQETDINVLIPLFV